jgi:putative Holliday junction resolvase
MQRGRRIAFDYGDVRIGVAVSDADSILVSPVTTLLTSSKGLLKEISAIFEEISPIEIYVGRPTNLSGLDGAATGKAIDFSKELEKITQIPVKLIDERMSTVSASKQLREVGKDGKSSKSMIDMAAAVAILEFAISVEKAKQ